MQTSFRFIKDEDGESTAAKTPRLNLGLKELDKITNFASRNGSFHKDLPYDNVQQVLTLQGLAMLLKEYGIQAPFVFDIELLGGTDND